MQALLAVMLFCALAASCFTDWRTRKVPNAIVACVLLAGLALQAAVPTGSGLFSRVDPGSLGFAQSLGGVAVGLAIFFPLFALRTMGAGDAKLFAAVGAWLGIAGTAWAALWTFVAGGLLALGAMALARSQRQVFSNLGGMVVGLMVRQSVSALPTSGRLPYALAITVGVAVEAARSYWPDAIKGLMP